MKTDEDNHLLKPAPPELALRTEKEQAGVLMSVMLDALGTSPKACIRAFQFHNQAQKNT